MIKYNKYKPTDIDWIDQIPMHWSVQIFKQISYMKGRIGWQGLKFSEFSDDLNLPYLITGMNFKGGKIRWNEVYHISEERYNEAKEIQLKENDILMTKDGTIGKLLFVDYLPGKASLNSHLLVLRAFKNKYHAKYLYYQLDSQNFFGHIEYNKYGTTFYGLTQEAMGRFITILPTFEEQTTIAQYLDIKTQAIDKKINLLTKKADYYKELRKSIINNAVCKGLDKNVKLKESGIEWIGEIPQHWEVKRLKDVAKVQTGNTPPMAEKENYSDIGFPWVKPNELFDLTPTYNTNDFISEIGKEQVRIIKKGSVMVCCIGSIGKMGVAGVDLCTNQQINSITFHKIVPEYGKFLVFVSKDEHIRHSTGNVVAILNCESQKRIEFAFPPTKEEQTAIANYLDEKTQKIDAIVTNIGKQIETLKELRKTLINDVVTGKIKVTVDDRI